MVLEYKRVSIHYAGIAQGTDGPLYIPVSGWDTATVHVVGAWTTAVISLKKSNTTQNAGVAYDIDTITNTDPLSEPVALSTEYLVIDVTTGEGSAMSVDIHVHLRRSSVAQAVTV